MFQRRFRLARWLLPFLTVLLVSAALTGCGLLEDDSEDVAPTSVPVNPGQVVVIDSAMATEVDANKQASGIVSNAFPPNTRQIFIVLVLTGVDVGTEITGRWFQLLNDGPPEGTELSSASVVLTEDNIVEGAARVELNLQSGSDGFPPDDYLVRIYAGEEFIKTSAFVISRFVVHPAAAGGATAPEPTPAGGQAPAEATATPGQVSPDPTSTQETAPTATQPPAPTATPPQQATPETYTVVSGDTLTIIAERFKPATESTESYVARIQQANELQPGAILFVGQVLTLPGP